MFAIEKNGLGSGIVIGKDSDTGEILVNNSTGNVLLMGPENSGKDVSTVIPTGLVWKDSMFVYDPKGELWKSTAGFRKEKLGQKVLKFQPLCMDGSGARWNPLAEIGYRTESEETDVMAVSSMLADPDVGDVALDSSCKDSVANLLRGVILGLLGEHAKANLPPPCMTDLLLALSIPDRYVDESVGNLDTVKMAQKALKAYQNSVVQENTSVSDFSIRDFLNSRQGVSLYFVTAAKDICTVKPIARLFVRMLCEKLNQNADADTGVEKARLLLMLNEFAHLGRMTCLEDMLASCFGSDVRMCLVCQDVLQIHKIYGEDTGIWSNCHVHLYHTPHCDNGNITARRIADAVRESGDAGDSNISDLMREDGILRMSSEKVLFVNTGRSVSLVDKVRYHKEPVLEKLAQIRPPVDSDTLW